MIALRQLLLFPLCLTFCAVASAQTLSGTSLSRQEVTLPAGNGATIIIAAFSRDAGEASDVWRQALSEHHPTEEIYTLIDLKPAPGFVRGMIVRSIRRDTPEALHDHYLIVTDSSPAWRQIARVADPSEPHVLKLAPSGVVCHRVVGSVTVDTLRALLETPCPVDNPAIRRLR